MFWTLPIIFSALGIVIMIAFLLRLLERYLTMRRMKTYQYIDLEQQGMGAPINSQRPQRRSTGNFLSPIREELAPDAGMVHPIATGSDWANFMAKVIANDPMSPMSKHCCNIERELIDLARREDKHYFLAQSSTHTPLLLSIIPHPPYYEWFMLEKDELMKLIQSVINILGTAKHLTPTLYMGIISSRRMPDAVVSLTEFSPNGSLKDYIFRRENPNAMLRTHQEDSVKRLGHPLQEAEIALIGRSILLGLKILNDAGLHFYSLTTANVILFSNEVKLTNYENFLLRLLPHPRTIEILASLKDSLDTQTVLFGIVMFEMAYGVELDTTYILNKKIYTRGLKEASEKIQQVLDASFGKNKKFPHPVSLDDLLNFPLFRECDLPKPATKSFKLQFTKEQRQFLKKSSKLYHEIWRKELDKCRRQLASLSTPPLPRKRKDKNDDGNRSLKSSNFRECEIVPSFSQKTKKQIRDSHEI